MDHQASLSEDVRKLVEWETAKAKAIETNPVSPQARLIVVSPRLPFIVTRSESGLLILNDLAIGIDYASILSRYTDRFTRTLAVGYLTVQGQEEPVGLELANSIRGLVDQEQYHCVFLSKAGLLPNRFADNVLLPILHFSASVAPDENKTLRAEWANYRELNEHIAKAVLDVYQPGDVISIHGHELMLLPQLLRSSQPNALIGYYLHTVFPSSEIYRVLPQRSDILRGLTGANVIAFHNATYARYFLSSCTRILGLECSASAILPCEESGGSRTNVAAVGMGVEPSFWLDVLSTEHVRKRITHLQDTLQGKKILLGIDSIDTERGLTHKLLAFQKFLRDNEEWRGKCVLMQVCEDNPNDIHPSKKALLSRILHIVGEINCMYGIDSVPVHFFHQSCQPQDVAPLYAIANVFIDTALRDVMSQRSFEFLCCNEASGVIILCEFSGSALSLRASALTVNPWDVVSFAQTILPSLTMEPDELEERLRYGRKYVRTYTVADWAKRYVGEIITACEDAAAETLIVRPQLDQEAAVDALRDIPAGGNVLILIGFVGTLSSLLSQKADGRYTESASQLAHNLYTLAAQSGVQVIIYTNSSTHAVDGLFPPLKGNIWAVAESGAFERQPDSDDWSTCRVKDISWLDAVEEIMEAFADRTPGSTVERRSCSIMWTFPRTQQEHGAVQSKELMNHLWAGPLLSAPAEVFSGSNFVEVCPSCLSAADDVENMISSQTTELAFSLVVGDFSSKDEDIHNTVGKFTNGHAFTCTIGKKVSRANYALKDSHDVAFLLAKLGWACARRKDRL